jgi:hypothetical protein
MCTLAAYAAVFGIIVTVLIAALHVHGKVARRVCVDDAALTHLDVFIALSGLIVVVVVVIFDQLVHVAVDENASL